MRGTQALGRYGEDVATRHLLDAGFGILERNWRCDAGELDIVARDGDVLVICEVKTRRGVGFGQPIEAISPAKLARLRRLSGRWMEQMPLGGRVRGVRIDVVGVLRPPRGPAQVVHLRGVG